MEPKTLVGLLAEPDRLRVFAAVVLGVGTPDEIASRTGLPGRDVVVAIRRLTQGGLLAIAEGGLVAYVEAFKEAIREYAEEPSPEAPLDPDRVKAAVLRAFVVDGRLVSIPAARAKRRIVLEHIVAGFEPGVKFPEREVDAVLRAWHPDYASLRRYLIDEDLMSRHDALYWRTGGPVPMPRP
jgi:hypothetical protein